MKGIICAVVLLVSLSGPSSWAQQNPASYSSIVYFITGGPVQLSDSGNVKKLAPLREFLKTNHPTSFFKMVHNTKWKDVLKEILAMKKQGVDGRLILMGHSYGATAVVDVARKLGEQKIIVDMMVSVDMIRRIGSADPDVIPDNVLVDFNFYETKDIMLRGRKNNHRKDNGHRGITNTEITGPFGAWPHHDLLRNLINDGILSQLAHGSLTQTMQMELAAAN
jgi:hypothetical protein